MLSKKDIEELATGAVKRYFNTCELISPQIQENDKTPDWDGYLNIYKIKKDVRNNYLGCLRIQVKGTQVDEFKEKESFPIETVFLNNARSEGFVFFVVEVKEDGSSKIFYKMMAPIEIRFALSKLRDGQYTKTMSFDVLSNDKALIYVQLSAFLNDCIKQKSFANKDELKIEDIQNVTDYQWGFTLQGKKENFANDIFNGISAFLYLKTKEGAEIPVGNSRMTVSIPEIKRTIIESVKINDIIISDSYILTYSKDYVTYEIPSLLSFKIINNLSVKKDNVSIDILAKTTEQYISAYSTYLLVLKETHIKFGEKIFTLTSTVGSEDISNVEDKIREFEKHAEVLRLLNVVTPIDYTKFYDRDNISIDKLYKGLVEHQPVEINNQKEIFRLDIANICLLLCSYSDNNGKYYIDNFFESLNVRVKSENTELPFEIPTFSWLEQRGYVLFDNIPYKKILDSYKQFALLDKRVYTQANLDLLEMIKAADELRDKGEFNKRELTLKVAYELSIWLIETNNNPELLDIHRINNLQIVKRSRPFKEDEQALLLSMSQSKDSLIKAAVYILLDKFDLATYIISTLPEENQKVFTSYPIYYFIKCIKSDD